MALSLTLRVGRGRTVEGGAGQATRRHLSGGRGRCEKGKGGSGGAQHPGPHGPHTRGPFGHAPCPVRTHTPKPVPGTQSHPDPSQLRGRPGATTHGHGRTHSRHVCVGVTLTCHRRGHCPPCNHSELLYLKSGATSRCFGGLTTILPLKMATLRAGRRGRHTGAADELLTESK